MKYNLVAVHPILTDEPATGIPIDLCGIMNGDFDGDQMGFIFVTEPDIVAQLQSDMTPEQIWFYEKEAKPTFTPTHEILYGLHLATSFGRKTNKKFVSFEQVEQAYKNSDIEYNDTILLDDKETTYARKKVENIIHMDLDAGLGEGVAIDTKNINLVMSGLSTHRRRAEETHDLTTFASEIVTHVGMGALPFQELYDKNDPEIDKIVNSDEPLAVRYNKLNNYIAKSIDDKIATLEGSSLPSMLKGSGRVKKSQLEEIYSPVIYMDGDDITISNNTLFGGLTERDFVTKGLENRQIQAIKRFGVPVGGYATRQMVMSQMDIIFDAERKSPDTIGLEIPLSEASGRTRMNGTVISDEVARKAMPSQRIRVKSCINHSDRKVYADEINQRDLREKDGAAIGISFAMSLTEAKTQAALALKHGGIKTGFEDKYAESRSSGTVVSIDNEYLTVMRDDGKEERYLMTEMVVPNVKVGARVMPEDHLISSRRLRQLHDQLADFEAFLGIQGIWSTKLTREAGRGLVMRYAPCSGIISYPNSWTIKIGDMSIPVNRKELYYYPEGYKIEAGVPFCSGVLDMHDFLQRTKNVQLSFDVFKAQMMEIYTDHKTRSEIFEVTFKGLMNSRFSAKRAYTGTDNFVNRMYAGDTRKGLEKFYKESPDNVIKIQDSIILPLALGFDTQEVKG